MLPVSEAVVNFAERFAIGRVQSVSRAGRAQAHPSVRWDGLPGRRSHSSMTPWALGLISTVRIGAGAWRKWANTRESGDTDRAESEIHHRPKARRNRKAKREEAFKERQPASGLEGTGITSRLEPDRSRARLRSTPLRSARTYPAAWKPDGYL